MTLKGLINPNIYTRRFVTVKSFLNGYFYLEFILTIFPMLFLTKMNTCKVNGFCFNANESNPNDWCKICDAASNGFMNRTLAGDVYHCC